MEYIRPRQQILHSRNPYIHKCCGCVHLRIGSIFACLIWAGFSLYFAILSFQGKSPFFSHIDNAAIYVFGIINIVYFGISLASTLPIYYRQLGPLTGCVAILAVADACLITDMVINIIIFIVKRPQYVQWCIDANSNQLNAVLQDTQISTAPIGGFDTTVNDFYNCNRSWEDELKFSILSWVLLTTVYVYWTVIIYSYSTKLEYQIRINLQSHLHAMPIMGGMMGPPMME